MNNHSFLFLTTQKVENFKHTRINHNYDSFVLPPEIIVELRSKINGKNILDESRINDSDITLRNANNKKMNFELCIIDNKPFINLSSLGWQDGFNDYELQVGNDLNINFSVDMNKASKNGTEFYDKSNFNVYDYQKVKENGIISIEI